VHVVECDHALHHGARLHDLARVEAGRRAFEQDAGRLAKQGERARDNESSDAEGDHDVGPPPAAQGDERGRRTYGARTHGVGGGFEPGGASVEAFVGVAVQHADDGQIHGQAGSADESAGVVSAVVTRRTIDS
jgi:hypothetical protein